MTAKSYTKEDLRKLMQERKQEQLLEKRIDSPLARYDNAGNLFCRVCELRIENVNFWTKHLVSKEHKQSLERIKKGHNQQPLIETKKRKIDVDRETNNQGAGKLQRTEQREENARPDKSEPSQSEPQQSDSQSVQQSNGEPPKAEPSKGELPKGFFDNPEEDAKARDEIYKDPLDDEYKRFERSMQEESRVAENLVEEDLTETQNYRELIEIDEQIEHWSRINKLEIQRDAKKQGKRMEVEQQSAQQGEDDDSDEDLEEELNILSNWRRKKTINR